MFAPFDYLLKSASDSEKKKKPLASLVGQTRKISHIDDNDHDDGVQVSLDSFRFLSSRFVSFSNHRLISNTDSRYIE